MSDLFSLTDTQMARLQPNFPKRHGTQRVDAALPNNGLPAYRNRGRVLIGIIFLNHNGLQWRDSPKEYGPTKALFSRETRWSDKGIYEG